MTCMRKLRPNIKLSLYANKPASSAEMNFVMCLALLKKWTESWSKVLFWSQLLSRLAKTLTNHPTNLPSQPANLQVHRWLSSAAPCFGFWSHQHSCTPCTTSCRASTTPHRRHRCRYKTFRLFAFLTFLSANPSRLACDCCWAALDISRNFHKQSCRSRRN